MNIYLINDIGRAAIRAFIDQHHVHAARLGDDAIDAWASQAESSVSVNGDSLLEIRTMYSISERPETLTLTAEHFDSYQMED